MTKKWEYERINPLDWLKSAYPEADVSHISFNPDLKYKGRYWRGKNGGDDGTLLFVEEDISAVMIPFLNKTTYALMDQPDRDLSGYSDVRYELGWIRILYAYGRVLLRCDPEIKYPGMVWRIKVRADATLVKHPALEEVE